MICDRCNKAKMEKEFGELYCPKCGNIMFLHKNIEKPSYELHTICEDGKGGYRTCLN